MTLSILFALVINGIPTSGDILDANDLNIKVETAINYDKELEGLKSKMKAVNDRKPLDRKYGGYSPPRVPRDNWTSFKGPTQLEAEEKLKATMENVNARKPLDRPLDWFPL